MPPTPEPGSLREHLEALARAEGFTVVAVAPAEVLASARAAALRARRVGALAEMRWMTPEWIERATDPGRFLEGSRSVVIVGLPARPPEPVVPAGDGVTRGRVARYAWGRDYHRVFERALRRLARRLRDEAGGETRVTVDYGPLLERPFAAAAGIGWIGRSTMLLAPGTGPWLLLGALATTLRIRPDGTLRKSCGSCVRCVVACPTGALGERGGALDARLCISYHTIENRGWIPRDLRERFGGWVFGCDACLDSCPVGASRLGSHPDLAPRSPDEALPPLADLLRLDDDAFAARFRGRAIMRARRDGLVRNACVALGNVGNAVDLGHLAGALGDRSAVVRGHAAWAVARLILRAVGADAEEAVRLLRQALDGEADPGAREEMVAALARLASPGAEPPAGDPGAAA